MEVHDIVQEAVIKVIPKKKNAKNAIEPQKASVEVEVTSYGE